ncbi:MAG: hypothetical protein V4487_02660, partial [Chlamydiota bacterium]
MTTPLVPQNSSRTFNFDVSASGAEHSAPSSNPIITLKKGPRVDASPRCLKIVSPSGRINLITLNAKCQQELDSCYETLENDPLVRAANPDNHEIVDIDINRSLIYLKDPVTGELSSVSVPTNLKGIDALRTLWQRATDPKNKGARSWIDRPPGVRGNQSGKPAFSQSTNHLKQLEYTNDDVENALDNGLSGNEKLKSLKTLYAAKHFRNKMDQAFQQCSEQAQNDPSNKKQARLDSLKSARAKLNAMSQFAIDFELTHPLSAENPDAPATHAQRLAQVEEKKKAAQKIIEDVARRPVHDSKMSAAANTLGFDEWSKETADPKAEEEFANDLALAHLTSDQVLVYRDLSKSLGAELKRDSYEEAFIAIAKAIVAFSENGNNPNNKEALDHALNSVMFQTLIGNLDPADRAGIEDALKGANENAVNEILNTLRNPELQLGSSTLPQSATSKNLIHSFTERAELLTSSYEKTLTLRNVFARLDSHPDI